MGQVWIPRAEQAIMYAMATNMVFFDAHVSADARDGTTIHRPNNRFATETPIRTQKESGTVINRGNHGYPDEKSARIHFNFNMAQGFSFQVGL